jgi:hypothetical protein
MYTLSHSTAHKRPRVPRKGDPSLTYKVPRMGSHPRSTPLGVPPPGNPSQFPDQPIAGVTGQFPTFPVNVNGSSSTSAVMKSHDLRYNWARTVEVQTRDKTGCRGISEMVFSYTTLKRLSSIVRADEALQKGLTWDHKQLEGDCSPALPVNQLDVKLKHLATAGKPLITSSEWTHLVQFGGIQITQPVLQACAPLLQCRQPLPLRDMITFTVQGQADVFNVWNRPDNKAIVCMDRLFVCIVQLAGDGGTITYRALPAVGTRDHAVPDMADNHWPWLPRVPQARKAAAALPVARPVLLASFFIGTVVAHHRIRQVKPDKLKKLYESEGGQHPQTLNMQIISVNIRL